MNELVYIKENFNIVTVAFVKNGKVMKKIYDWYLPYYYQDRLHIHTNSSIHINGQKKKVFIVSMSYHPDAQKMYKQFPLLHSQPSWQIQLIAQILNSKNIQYYRERTFKNLTTVENRPLRIDLSFQQNNQWSFIEYHGVHHYFKKRATTKRFQNILRNMEIKRQWCLDNRVLYLEIPFFRQREIQKLVETFLKSTLLDPHG
ncbi:hypothetical protein C6P52_04140 [Enterococcus mundtii]|uniref:hypothetical protein n=1 Tax=Enterococcus mundtii TaxID=53346 RepID=UPI000D3D1FA0|nr:hypothetical protein [Enterococcus mundtii]PTO39700.1 hypothetical protein C6P52_04140 [Enterococcus mundtii]PTO45275.1 hypothetical protein C6P54_01015 [Enterococcus mundtii]